MNVNDGGAGSLGVAGAFATPGAVLRDAGGDKPEDAAREDAKKMKNMRQPEKLDVGRIMVGQNTEKATRY